MKLTHIGLHHDGCRHDPRYTHIAAYVYCRPAIALPKPTSTVETNWLYIINHQPHLAPAGMPISRSLPMRGQEWI